MAIFTGLDGKKMPDRYLYQHQKTRLLYEYETLSILDFTDEELEKSNNPFAMVMLAAKTSLLEGKIPELELLDRKILIANKLFRKGFSAKKIRAIFNFLEGYVLFEDPEMNRTFREQVKSIEMERNKTFYHINIYSSRLLQAVFFYLFLQKNCNNCDKRIVF